MARASLADALARRILVLDGAMGTMIQQRNLTAADFGGAEYEGCNENLVLTRPDVIRAIHEAYLEAGADIVETNTFGATSIVLAEYDLAAKAREINRVAARLARDAADRFSTPERPRFVAGSIGPTTKTLSVTGGTTFDALVQAFHEQASGLIEGGVDALLVETAQDTLNVKAAALGVELAQREAGTHLPLMLSCTIEPMGTMLAGQAVDAFWAAVEHFQPVTVGLNCATGPEFMTDHVRELAGLAPCGVSVYPNAGLPDENGHYDETPESFTRKLGRFVDSGWVNVVGGCCGTTPDFIRRVAQLVDGRAPRTTRPLPRRLVSGIEALEISADPNQRPILVGERTNVIGSRKFKRLVAEGKLEEAAEIGRAQVKNGAQVVDVCLADPDRDEAADMEAFLPRLTRVVKAPLMIDSTDAKVLESALKRSQGKAIVNSINLEDGEERFDEVAPLLRRYGAAVVVGCIDEDKERGMAVTRERKLAIAERSFRLLTEKHGIPARDILFDPLVFPCATGDATYVGSGPETIEGVRLIAERFPECSTILGISNVSFGLPPAGREVLNSVFLYHCVQAGLTFAIVNAESLERYADIPEEDRRLAEDVLFHASDETIARFTDRFRGAKSGKETKGAKLAELPIEQRLASYIVQGTKEGLRPDLDRLLADGWKPLDVINGPLMAGMDEVGRLFNANELIVAEVLQSAEVMKAAVGHLEPFMEKADGATKGTIVLATVKGDVHDIGKNLVEIVLGNNGFRIVNLGIKVPPEELVKAVRQHKPDAIGLSGLLVKSAQQMVVTAEDLAAAGIATPILVGGAALTQRFTAARIAPAYQGPVLYAKDAMRGLSLANDLLSADPAVRAKLLVRNADEQASLAASVRPVAAATEGAPVPLDHGFDLPRPPDFKRHVLRDVDPRAIWPYVNKVMLFGKHLGLKGDVEKLIAQGDERATQLWTTVEELLDTAAREGWIQCRAAFRWFPARRDGETLVIDDPEAPGAKAIERFTFPRQRKAPHRSLVDFTRPDAVDTVAFFVTTAGIGVRPAAEKLKQDGRYLESVALQALAIEVAEGLAEYVHKRIRQQWGLVDDPAWTPRDLFRKAYRGVRVSFGYPACPDLADQAKLFRLLDPADLGVQLTEGYMMDPEATVSALVFHHPEADYFSVE